MAESGPRCSARSARRLARRWGFLAVGERVRVRWPDGTKVEGNLEAFLGRLRALPDTAGLLLPPGVRACLPLGSETRRGLVVVHETAPRVHPLLWRNGRSWLSGIETEPRVYRLALPYVVLVAVFGVRPGGELYLTRGNEVYFSNRPLRADSQELFLPALLNCGIRRGPGRSRSSLLCSDQLKPVPSGGVQDLPAMLDSLVRHLFETGFNPGVDFPGSRSGYTLSVAEHVDPRIRSPQAWEEASDDPLFVLEVPWLSARVRLRDVLERLREGCPGPPVTARSLALLVEPGSLERP